MDLAVEREVVAREDGPRLQRMVAAGAPLSVAERALALTRAALRAAGPTNGSSFLKWTRGEILRLNTEVTRLQDEVVRLRGVAQTWRKAAMAASQAGAEVDGE
jgi:hypothetical protein